jgi:hypothetical protein
MAFLTYQATIEDKQQTERQQNKNTYQILKGLNILKSIIPKVLTLPEKQEEKQDPTTTCIYFKCFKNFGDLNSLLKENNMKKKQLKEKCKICAACHAFV